VVGFSTGKMTITTWGTGEGPDTPQRWRARMGNRYVEFFADRDAPWDDLIEQAEQVFATGEVQTDPH
jgi:hypothetical protein